MQFNFSTFLVVFFVALLFFAIVINSHKNKKKGKSSCSCGCNGCANSAYCHSKTNKE